MAINIDTPGSPGWWLARLDAKRQERLPRLEKLQSYYAGDPPLPTGAKNARRAYAIFQAKARLNLAELIVASLRERLKVRAIHTAVQSETWHGDEKAWGIYRANGLDVELPDVLENMLALGDGYMIAGIEGEGEDAEVVITGEDPRQVVTIHDPVRQSRIRAASKSYRDLDLGMDYQILWLPAGPGEKSGRRWVAARPSRSRGGALRFDSQSWAWVKPLGGPDGLATGISRVPVVRFRNRRGIGEFEPHIDVLDRINHMILQRMVIATMQAFRQRAVKGDLPTTYPEDHPRAGQEIDYDELFESDPGALWLLPASVEIWESGQVDLQGILSAVKDDITHLAAVSRRPISMLAPDSANQSAEGASLTREGLTFAAEDRSMRAGQGMNLIMSIAFELLGDEERKDLTKISTDWYPTERNSIAAKGSAAAQSAQAGMSTEFILEHVFQMTPDQIQREKNNRISDLMLGAPLVGAPASPAAPAQDAAAEATRLKDAATALGQLIRAGVDPSAAADRVGLSGLKFSGKVPVSLRDEGE